MDTDGIFIPRPAYVYLGAGDTPIRAYFFCNIDDLTVVYQPDFRRLVNDIRNSNPLLDPYTWCVYGTHRAVIVNNNDLRRHETRHRLPPTYHIPGHPYDGEAAAYNDDEDALEGFIDLEFAYDHLIGRSSVVADPVACSGLTQKQISKNLRLAVYNKKQEEEEEEICVVCQVEFEKNERLGVLQCKHQYHPMCITEWLIRQNVCPLCKGQGLRV